ncbi:hypothetical protein RUM43_007933 [Polyplax serrata]|uniref:Phosphatidic acid phosphatase type 2/haloperoxidase domain-containing protein n=1 Tax=Polyplax serrata TaxID=468196 RepID=A0AAN8S5U7_POLSC
MPNVKYVVYCLAVDILLRLFLFSIYAVFQAVPPFKRVIHPEEVWLYKNPRANNYCPMKVLWEIVLITPSAAIFANYFAHKNRTDVIQAFLTLTLSIGLNGAITNVVKVIVGRPRPDFYYRCFPTGDGNPYLQDCTGNLTEINEGLKSFPSGHSSIAFASLGFLSLYIAGKLHLFSSKDVLCGSILGFCVSWLCYHNYYPPLSTEKCHMPWVQLNEKRSVDSIAVKEI